MINLNNIKEEQLIKNVIEFCKIHNIAVKIDGNNAEIFISETEESKINGRNDSDSDKTVESGSETEESKYYNYIVKDNITFTHY